jgi:hypothetical protein
MKGTLTAIIPSAECIRGKVLSRERGKVGCVCALCSFEKHRVLPPPLLDGSRTKETRVGRDPARRFENYLAWVKNVDSDI